MVMITSERLGQLADLDKRRSLPPAFEGIKFTDCRYGVSWTDTKKVKDGPRTLPGKTRVKPESCVLLNVPRLVEQVVNGSILLIRTLRMAAKTIGMANAIK